ncbi:beta-glucosidase, partial [Striga asiatica]
MTVPKVVPYDFGRHLTRHDFPTGFLFGGATSAYQVEGAYNVGGRGMTNWDAWSLMKPGKVLDGGNGCRAIDHYHNIKEDVKLMKDMGIETYRFSISWTRILPGGQLSTGVNKEGVKFYNDMIDLLIEARIEPIATIFHFDTPRSLQDEIFYMIQCGMNAQAVQGGKIGIVVVRLYLPVGTFHYSEKKEDKEAAVRAVEFMLGWFVQPLVSGEYPDSIANARERAAAQVYGKGEEETYKKKQPHDPTNYYTDQEVEFHTSKNGIPIGPQGWMKRTSSSLVQIALKDDYRIKYHQQHLAYIKRAIDEDKVNVKGYAVWSIFDNYERAAGWYMNFLNKKKLPGHFWNPRKFTRVQRA